MTQTPDPAAGKRRSLSLRTKLFLAFTVLVVLTLALLWLSQTVFLDDIYQFIRTREVKTAADRMTEMLGEDDYATKAELLAEQRNVCVSVYRIASDESATLIATGHVEGVCLLHTAFSEDVMNQLYDGAREEKYFTKKFRPAANDGRGGFFRDEPALSDSIVCATLVPRGEYRYFIVISAAIMPVSATVNTLRVLLICTTVVLLLVSAALAIILSKTLAAPLSDMNREAKKLAAGNYGVQFSGRGLRETEELGDTLNYAAEELSKTDRMQKELIANISHDLRTPLTMIAGYSEVMRDIPGEMTPENMQVIIDETGRLTSLVNDTLDLSRLGDGQTELAKTVFPLTQELRETAARFGKLLAKGGYTFTLECGEDVSVYADKTRILQVLYNLLNNAVNYTGEDKSVLIRQTVKGGVCRVSVTDTGEGIPEDQLPLIWERYYKLSEYHRRGTVGSGLGLSIVKNILLLHGARFGVSSRVGSGTTFWFELPVREGEV